jgi:putative sugar O-methyltransferase
MRLKLVSLSPNFENQRGWGDDFPHVKLPEGGVRVGSGASGSGVLSQQVAVKAGASYRIIARARCAAGAPTNAKCQINWYGARDEVLGVSQQTFPLAGNTNTTSHTYDVEAPAAAKRAVLYVVSVDDKQVVYLQMGLYKVPGSLFLQIGRSASRKLATLLRLVKSAITGSVLSLILLAKCFWCGLRPVRLETPRLLFVTTALRARENKIASALRENNCEVYLIYINITPHKPDKEAFTRSFAAPNISVAWLMAILLRPQVCHVFSGAVDRLIVKLVGRAPFPVICDINDIFAPSLMTHNQERFAAVAFCLANADGLCARDSQPRVAKTEDHWALPKRTILFSEFPRGGQLTHPRRTGLPDELRVVSVGTFTLESHGHHDSAYLKLAKLFIRHRIHFTIYPHWNYVGADGVVDKKRLHQDFRDFLALSKDSPYLHLMEPVPERELLPLLSEHDFGLVSGGNPLFGQKLGLVTEKYMRSCYSGRISDYLDAGLPVLINREVAFGYRMLRHYGVALDLEQILQPDFADKLRDAKKDPELSRRVALARQKLALRNQAPRLIKFYRQIAFDRRPPRQARFPEIGRHSSGDAFRSIWKRLFIRLAMPFETRLARRLPSFKSLSLERSSAEQTIHSLRQELVAAKQKNGPLPTAPSRSSSSKLRVDAAHVSGLLNWPGIEDKNYPYLSFGALLEMLRLHNEHGGIYSECWSLIGEKHLTDLLTGGFCNFKRSLATHYFNFLVQDNDPQQKFLLQYLPTEEVRLCREAASLQEDDPELAVSDQRAYRAFVLMLWRYAELRDREGELERLSEPSLGSPFKVEWKKRLISSDLANAFLEYSSIKEALGGEKPNTIMEIGGGYGRTAYLLLHLFKPIRMIMVDIPPALYVAQRYLTTLFPNLRAVSCEDFQQAKNKSEILNNADLVFLLPHQTLDLPDKYADLILNISSLGEMTREQIRETVNEIDRIGKGVFYTKQWKVSQNPFDDLVLSLPDYEFPRHWRLIFERDCQVQTQFFEAAFEIL